ncbi:MAG: hypothetical protein EOO88_26630 [Pedobacter sp.]|nr:MAG: hypothetical protein EOO88_26630 [Pedobacter sp.]
MRKKYTFLMLLCFAAVFGFAHDGRKVRELSVICKTWGLLKYYHPGIAKGQHDWDSVLVAATGRVLAGSRQGQVESEVERLFLIAGENSSPALQSKVGTVHTNGNYDVSWISGEWMLSREKRRRLLHTVAHPFRGRNFYAQPNPDNDSTVFTPNEKPYKEMLFPDVNYRLLALFRFWNVVNYYYPYKYAIGKPWASVLQEMVPVLIEATDTLSYHKALAKMSASINDSHGSVWPSVFTSFTGKYSPPFNFALQDGKAVVTEVLDSLLSGSSNIQVGSVISAIDGISIRRRVKANLEYVPASNYGGKLKTMHGFILNSRIPKALYSFKNPDGKKVVASIGQVERNFIKDYVDFMKMTSPVVAKVMDGNIGYIYFSNLNGKNLDSAMNAVAKTKAIIFDMRNYPTNGYGIYYVPNYLLGQPKIYARNTYPDFSLPGIFHYKVANDDTQVGKVGKNNSDPYTGKVILLVDHRTQSAAEWACMTLMTADNVTVIGNQTAGADGNVTRTVLPGNYKVSFSGLGIYFPDGSQTQRVGIPIDVRVDYSIEDWVRGRDPLLEKAIQFANKKPRKL